MIVGAITALGAAVTFAFNNAAFRRGALGGSVAQAMAIGMGIGVVLALVAVTLIGAWGNVFALPRVSVGLLALAGILHFAWGRYCNFRATKAMGSNMVGPLQQSSILLALALAVFVLGEVITPLRILGILLIILGPLVSLRAGRNARRAAEQGARPKGRAVFRPNLVEGYTFALLSVTGYGSSPILIRYSVQDAGLADSIAGWLIASVAAAMIIALTLLPRGRVAHVRAVDRSVGGWFALSGVLVGLSQMLGFIALSFAPVTVVTPIQRLSLVIRVFANRLINRDHEVTGPRIWVATLVAMAGVLALTISTDVVTRALPLPDVMKQLLVWHWSFK